MATSIKNSRISKGEKIGSAINYFFIALIVLLCIYPFLNVVSISLSSNRAILSGEVTFYPIEPQLQSFKQILAKRDIWISMRTTLVVVLLGTLLGLFLTICAAYTLSKKRLKGRVVFSFLILFTMFFGGGIIPTFLVVKGLGLLDTIGALILPSALNVFNFVVMRTFFTQLPESLEEAAMLDGCNDIGILVKIVLPLSMPIIATIGLFYAVNYWNEYFTSLMYITDPDRFTLQLKLRQLIFTEELNQIGAAAGTGEGLGQQVMPESLKSASIVVSTIPIILVYPWLQKYFVKGVMLGSVKG